MSTLENITDIRLKEGLLALGVTNKPTCFRPHTYMLFHPNGYATACCYACKYPYGKYPEQSLHDIWFGKARQDIIKAMDNEYDFHLTCDQVCYEQVCIKDQGCMPAIMRTEGFPYPAPAYPTRLELIIDTVCNYECIMCGGYLSSSIRRNREHSIPHKIPYDDEFVNQLEEFIPHVGIVYMSGGEPLVAPYFLKVLERIAKINSDAFVELTSNCSTYNKRTQKILDLLPNLTVTVSLNAISKDNYKFITTHGDIDNVLGNLKKLGSRLNKMNVCPMIQNVNEIPNLVKFCDENNVIINFLYCFMPTGGKLKGIHIGGTNEYAEGIRLPDNVLAQKPFIPEFNLATLSKSKLQKIHDNLIKITEWCSPQNQHPVKHLCHRISALADK